MSVATSTTQSPSSGASAGSPVKFTTTARTSSPAGDDGALPPELRAGMQERRALEPEEQHRRGRGASLAAVPGPVARVVVVGQDPRRPGVDRIEQLDDAVDPRAPHVRLPWRVER